MMNFAYFCIGFAVGGAVFTVVWLTFHNYFYNGLRKTSDDILKSYSELLREHWRVCTELESLNTEECVVSGKGRTISLSELGDQP